MARLRGWRVRLTLEVVGQLGHLARSEGRERVERGGL